MKVKSLLRGGITSKKVIVLGLFVLFVLSIITMLTQQSYAARFTNRSLKIESARLGAETTYTLNFGFPTTASVGSVQLEFCDDPIPDIACTQVAGLDVSGVTLASQTGEVGFAVTQQSVNKFVLSRAPSTTGLQVNSYVFNNMVNPTEANKTFYVRITSYASSNASGNFIDYGGAASVATRDVGLQTQIAPELIFCVALEINGNTCGDIESGNFIDFGELSADQTYSGQSQMRVRTNAAAGYSVSVYGIGVTAGNKVISSLEEPTMNAAGNSQFGINLTANTSPAVGADQDGPGPTAVINPDYAQQDYFLYRSGDTLLNTTTTGDFTRYTISYILNRPVDQPAGVYATTITYICTGNF